MAEKQTLGRFPMTDAVKATCFKHVVAVHTDYAGPWGQSKNAVAARRVLSEVLAGKPFPATKSTELATVLGVLHFFSNASAVRQAVLEKKSSGGSTLAEDYSAV